MVLESVSRRWPAGRVQLPQQFVDDHKRERCALAIGELAHECGGAALTVDRICRRAKIARATFYDLFEGCDGAFQFAYELGVQRLREAIEVGAEPQLPWRERVDAAIGSLLRAIEADPYLAELCLVHGGSRGDPACAPPNLELVQTLAEVLGQARAERTNCQPPALTEELMASGLIAAIATQVRRKASLLLGDLQEELTTLASMPFLPELEPMPAITAE